MAAERRVKPGDLVTDRFGNGAILTQNMFKPNSRGIRLNAGEVALVTWAGVEPSSFVGAETDVCYVLFRGEVWRTNTISLRVVSDG